MKKLLTILLSLALVFAIAACTSEAPPEETPEPVPTEEPAPAPEPEPEPESPADPVAEPIVGVTIPAFEVFVNGVSVTHEMMAEYPVYSVQATSVNSSGTETTATYIGFAINNVLDAAGLSGNFVWLDAMAGDGYAVTVKGDEVMADTTLLAMTKDGSPFNAGPWLAPCTDTVTGNYLKDTISILVNTSDENPGMDHTLEAGESASVPDGPPETLDRTDKVEFEPYSFLVNGEEVTNEDLDGLSIFKVTAVTENSAGEIRENGYTGYRLADVLEALGITDAVKVTAITTDEDFTGEYVLAELEMDWVLVAIERDGEVSADGSIWIAPCAETSARAYTRDVIELIVE